MSSDDIEPFDWSRRFFGLGRRGFFDDMFREFDQMKREMEREFEDIGKRIPKDSDKRIHYSPRMPIIHGMPFLFVYIRFGIAILIALCLNNTANTIDTIESKIPVRNMRL